MKFDWLAVEAPEQITNATKLIGRSPDINGAAQNRHPSDDNKYGYPPDLQEGAVKTVLMQAELLCADWA